MSRVPAFLLGGINKTYNFLGLRTVRTAGYGLVEMTLKLSPVFLFVAFSAKEPQQVVKSVPQARALVAAQLGVPMRRTSLHQ